ncbi:hypothetical protein ETD86_29560 [Nonomuraea turkmeniaca]|uniref:Uncharacterized protein n=1 Tax=Nonomuraea turkmeniaca TaxID=103838 RepID=A0A5S4FAJ9_9ACTN|nr:hypothetical protein [Nonomuraea turkmeniaca]TMR14095.1 hypothetical protein ETD86_29560 [Nonomuraea turkmeniaca]
MVQFRAMHDDLAETQAVLLRVIEVLREHAPDLVVEDPTSLEHRGGGGRFTFAVLRVPGGPRPQRVKSERVDQPAGDGVPDRPQPRRRRGLPRGG